MVKSGNIAGENESGATSHASAIKSIVGSLFQIQEEIRLAYLNPAYETYTSKMVRANEYLNLLRYSIMMEIRADFILDFLREYEREIAEIRSKLEYEYRDSLKFTNEHIQKLEEEKAKKIIELIKLLDEKIKSLDNLINQISANINKIDNYINLIKQAKKIHYQYITQAVNNAFSNVNFSTKGKIYLNENSNEFIEADLNYIVAKIHSAMLEKINNNEENIYINTPEVIKKYFRKELEKYFKDLPESQKQEVIEQAMRLVKNLESIDDINQEIHSKINIDNLYHATDQRFEVVKKANALEENLEVFKHSQENTSETLTQYKESCGEKLNSIFAAAAVSSSIRDENFRDLAKTIDLTQTGLDDMLSKFTGEMESIDSMITNVIGGKKSLESQFADINSQMSEILALTGLDMSMMMPDISIPDITLDSSFTLPEQSEQSGQSEQSEQPAQSEQKEEVTSEVKLDNESVDNGNHVASHAYIMQQLFGESINDEEFKKTKIHKETEHHERKTANEPVHPASPKQDRGFPQNPTNAASQQSEHDKDEAHDDDKPKHTR